MEVGCRVLRGPDWKWQNQDEGEGHLGTVVEIGKPGNNNTPDMTVVVQWDSGFRTNYRIGYQGSYDLRVYDNAPTGVRHPNIVCDECKQQGVMGIRWKCAKCFDFDLCHMCYMDDKHDINHPFVRFDTANSIGVKVIKRANTPKTRTKGIFDGARVVRGPDWDWGNQDGEEGGDGMVGAVEDIRGWDNESGRSVANVTWASGMTNVYRLGHKGKADLKYLQSTEGPYCYKDHLPILGKNVETSIAAMTHSLFKVGDQVRVGLDVDVLKTMQEGHGGWNPRMSDYIGKIGSVHRITDKGDVRVQFEGCTNRWTFHAAALSKIQQYAVGDYVKVSVDIQKVKDAQKGHGEWTDNMKSALGKTGRVLKVYADGDLRITVGGNTWTFNPLCCISVSYGQQQQDNNNTLTSTQEERQDHTKLLGDTTTGGAVAAGVMDTEKQLVKEAAQGHVDVVSAVLAKYPDKVDQKSSGKTALHVASHQGHIDIVRVLLAAKAKIELQDDDGDSALHYSAFGNQREVMELLLEHSALINKVNSAGCTALHVAVNKQHVQCTSVLLRRQCDVNIQDSYGDTALHDAIGKNNHEIIDQLINYPRTDFTLRNKRGFNPLHHAALKGNNYATEHILQKARQVVNSRKEDGFSSVHLAALNGHKDVVSTLISLGRADLEIQNNRQQTPLLLAVTQGHVKIMEYLVNKGASVKAVDEEGNSPLHVALMRQTATVGPPSNSAVGRIQATLSLSDLDSHAGLAMAAYLLQNGADPYSKNQQNKSALELISSQTVLEVFNRYILPQYLGASSSGSSSRQQILSASSMATPPPPPLPPQRHTSRSASKSSSSKSRTGQPRSAHNTPHVQAPQASKSSPAPSPYVQAPPPGSNIKTTTPAPTRVACMVCEEMALVRFEPCGHQIACADCCIKMKKCLKCRTEIKYKLGLDGKPIGKEPFRVEDLQKRVQEMEDSVNCSICMERPKNVAFLCGHSACVTCAKPLQICHMCRKPISKKINLF